MAIIPFKATEAIHGNHGAFEGASTMFGALNTEDGETFGVNWNGAGAGESSCTLNEPMEAKEYVLTLRCKSFGSPGSNSTIRFGLSNGSSKISYGALLPASAFNGTLHTVEYHIPYAPVASPDFTPNRIWFQTNNVDDAGTYTLFDLITAAVAQEIVTVSSDAHSSWDEEGAVGVDPGSDYVGTFTPAAGYEIEEILVDDEPVADVAGLLEYELTIENVTEAHTVSGSAVGVAQDLPAGVTIAVSPSGSGKRLGNVFFSNPNARTGETVNIHVKPAAGGKIHKVVIDGDDISAPLAATWAALAPGVEYVVQDYEVPAEPVIVATFSENVQTGGGSYRSGTLTGGAGVENFADRTANVEAALRRDYPVQPF